MPTIKDPQLPSEAKLDNALPHFILIPRPVAVPTELLELPDDARIRCTQQEMAGWSGSGIRSAGECRAQIEKTIARQAEGYFTLNEAAQILADSRPGLNSMDIVRRFKIAHSKGELRIRRGGSRFPLEVGEEIRDFHDTVRAPELDAWLLTVVGYGFPESEVAPKVEPEQTPAPATTQPEAVPIAQVKPVQRSAAQDAAILAAIRSAGHEPLSLPNRERGKSGIKAEIRALLVGRDGNFPKEGRQFDKAWERLRASREINGGD